MPTDTSHIEVLPIQTQVWFITGSKCSIIWSYKTKNWFLYFGATEKKKKMEAEIVTVYDMHCIITPEMVTCTILLN